MNELLFIAHILFVFATTVLALFNGPFVLQTLAALYVVFANLFVMKKMMLFGVLVSGCDVYLIGSICALLMGREMWGRRFVTDLTFIAAIASVIFLVLCWFQVSYIPLETDTVHQSFVAIIGLMPWVTICSLAAHGSAQLLTLGVVGFLSAITGSRWPTGVAFIAMFTGQILDSVLFLGGAFWGELALPELLPMIGVSVGFKITLIALSSFLVGFAAWCRRNGYAY